MSYNGLQTVEVYDQGRQKMMKKRAFVLKDGPSAMIYIPISKLAGIDYHRLKDIEAKGGEMLTAMRDNNASNGVNMLVLYQNLIEVFHKPEENEEAKEPQSLSNSDYSLNTTTGEFQEQPKKKRGRPPKNKNS